MASDNSAGAAPPSKGSLLYDPKVRGIFFQVVLLSLTLFLLWEFVQNARQNLEAQKIATGLGFLDNTAGFGISQTLIAYSESSSYGRVFWVGMLNTLIVGVFGVILATIVGFLVGVARLSTNWLLAKAATAYVELIRNLPLLFQILFWYLAVLGAMPGPRQAINIGDAVFLSNRGIAMPALVFQPGAGMVGIALLLGILASIGVKIWAKRRQDATGQQFHSGRVALILTIGLPLLVFLLSGRPIGLDMPQMRGFNFSGGINVVPEFIALLIALVTYTASFIAEIVRAGIMAVSHGQTEAGRALGISEGRILNLIVVPQALRVIIPPLTSQYLNLIKNSSLAVGIGYPDLVAVFAGTTLNQTGQAIEIIAITMACYLLISLVTSLFMNWYNAHVALVER